MGVFLGGRGGGDLVEVLYMPVLLLWGGGGGGTGLSFLHVTVCCGVGGGLG